MGYPHLWKAPYIHIYITSCVFLHCFLLVWFWKICWSTEQIDTSPNPRSECNASLLRDDLPAININCSKDVKSNDMFIYIYLQSPRIVILAIHIGEPFLEMTCCSGSYGLMFFPSGMQRTTFFRPPDTTPPATPQRHTPIRAWLRPKFHRLFRTSRFDPSRPTSSLDSLGWTCDMIMTIWYHIP